jgi:hypothetical protein
MMGGVTSRPAVVHVVAVDDQAANARRPFGEVFVWLVE